MSESPASSLEVSSHYTGDAGKAYFEYQKQGVLIGGKIEARKFAPYVKPTDTLLDFGCGSGAILMNLKAARKMGVEPNPAARQFLSDHAQGAIEPFASIEAIADQTVDIVITNHCLEHVPCPITVLRHLHRVLKPGGRIVAFVPIDDWRIQRSYNSADINHHLHTWSPLLFGHTLAEGGFTQIDTQVFTSAFPPRGDRLFGRIPGWLFDLAGWATAVLRKRRQVRGVAIRP